MRIAGKRSHIGIVLWFGIFLLNVGTQAAVPGCAGTPAWQPQSGYQPDYFPERPQGDVSVIVLHGKGGSKYSAFFHPLRDRLLKLGYNVIIPQMTWSHLWDGTQCQGLNFLQRLVKSERAKGMRVLLVGHSMGGMHSLIYAHYAGNDLAGVVPVAPGHMLPLSKAVVEQTAPYVDRAKRMEANGQGDKVAVFKTLNGYQLQDLETTATIYLSYHDPERTADFRNVIPAIKPPWLWVVGANDSIKAFNDKVVVNMPARQDSAYRVTAGDDHFTVLDRVAGLLNPWFLARSSIGPRPRQRQNPHLMKLLAPALLPD